MTDKPEAIISSVGLRTETPLCLGMAQFRFVGSLQTTPDRGRLWLFLGQLHESLESTKAPGFAGGYLLTRN